MPSTAAPATSCSRESPTARQEEGGGVADARQSSGVNVSTRLAQQHHGGVGANLFVKCGQRARHHSQLATVHGDQIGICAKKGWGRRPRSSHPQHVLDAVQAGHAQAAVRLGDCFRAVRQNEVGGGGVGQGEIESIQRNRASCPPRHVQHAVPQRSPPGVGSVQQPVVCNLSARDCPASKPGAVEAKRLELGQRRVGSARRVG